MSFATTGYLENKPTWRFHNKSQNLLSIFVGGLLRSLNWWRTKLRLGGEWGEARGGEGGGETGGALSPLTAVLVVVGVVASRVWLYSIPVPARHAAAVPSWPRSEPSSAPGPHWLAARPRDERHTAGIFANSYWQLVRRRPEILQTFYTESRRMKFGEIDQCWGSSKSKFRGELWEVIGLKVVWEEPHPV